MSRVWLLKFLSETAFIQVLTIPLTGTEMKNDNNDLSLTHTVLKDHTRGNKLILSLVENQSNTKTADIYITCPYKIDTDGETASNG